MLLVLLLSLYRHYYLSLIAAKAPLDVQHHDSVQMAEVQRQADLQGCAPQDVPRGSLSYAAARNGKGDSTSERKAEGG
jgi:hypothetical protein